MLRSFFLKEKVISAKVKHCHINENSEVYSKFDTNLVLNTILYGIEFPDRAIKQYAPNIIAKNIYLSLDKNGYSKIVLNCVLNYTKDDRVIDKANKYIITTKSCQRIQKAIIGWKLLVC